MKKHTVLAVALLVCLLAVGYRADAGRGHAAPGPIDPARFTAWVSETLREAQTIRPGMTRGQLLEVFTTEGGISTDLQRTYVYRKCPYIKVDVQFRAVGRPPRDREGRVTLHESPRDVITSVSRPYLQWSTMD